MHPSERIIWDLLRTSLNDMILISPKLLGSLTQLWGKHSIYIQRDFLIHCGFCGNFEHFKPTKDHLASAILSHRPLPLFLLWCHSSLLSRRVPWFHQWNSKGQLLRRHLHFHLALVTTHHWSHHPCGLWTKITVGCQLNIKIALPCLSQLLQLQLLVFVSSPYAFSPASQEHTWPKQSEQQLGPNRMQSLYACVRQRHCPSCVPYPLCVLCPSCALCCCSSHSASSPSSLSCHASPLSSCLLFL